MIFRFAECKRLTFTYAELLDLGIPKSCMMGIFEESAPDPQPVGEHQLFLKHLHSWFVTSQGRQEEVDPPSSPVFCNRGGALKIESKDREAQIIDVALHHGGQMVG